MIELRQTEVFAAWIAGLRDRRAAVIVGRRLDRIANGNFGDVEPVSERVSELRIHYGRATGSISSAGETD